MHCSYSRQPGQRTPSLNDRKSDLQRETRVLCGCNSGLFAFSGSIILLHLTEHTELVWLSKLVPALQRYLHSYEKFTIGFHRAPFVSWGAS